MRTLAVVGSKGMLGSDLMSLEPAGWTLVGVDLPELDIRIPVDVLNWVRDARPDALINAAAFTNVDACETREAEAKAINATGAANLALACRENHVHFIHISTDYVFDGALGRPYVESDQANPINAYGRTKLQGERAVSEVGGAWSIVRTQWLFGPRGQNFVEKILKLAEERPSLRVVHDQIGCPTYTVHLARQIERIAKDRVEGLLHASSQGQCSWFDLARAVLDGVGKKEFPLEPIPTSDYPLPARRPLFSVLRNQRLSETIGDSMPDWEVGADEYLARRKGPLSP